MAIDFFLNAVFVFHTEDVGHLRDKRKDYCSCLNPQCPPQAHVLNCCAPVVGTILEGFGTFKNGLAGRSRSQEAGL